MLAKDRNRTHIILFFFIQPGRVIPLNVVMQNMIGLTAQAQNELRVARRELRKYKSLKLTSEQQKYLENFVSFLINNAHMLRCFISIIK